MPLTASSNQPDRQDVLTNDENILLGRTCLQKKNTEWGDYVSDVTLLIRQFKCKKKPQLFLTCLKH